LAIVKLLETSITVLFATVPLSRLGALFKSVGAKRELRVGLEALALVTTTAFVRLFFSGASRLGRRITHF